MDCIICSNHMIQVYEGIPVFDGSTNELFTLFRCPKCDHYSISEPSRPIAEYFRTDYSPHRERTGIRKYLYRRWALDFISLLKSRLPDPAMESSIVDVGCGGGSFLEVLRSLGYTHTIGVEPYSSAVSMARARGFAVIHQSVECWCESNVYQVAFGNNVLEQFADPAAGVRNIYQALVPGGTFAGEVPNGSSVGFRILGRNWGHIYAPIHRQIFTQASLRILLTQAGFENVQFYRTPNSSEWAYALDVAYRRRRSPASNATTSRLFPYFMLISVPVEVAQFLFGYPTGHIKFIAGKPS